MKKLYYAILFISGGVLMAAPSYAKCNIAHPTASHYCVVR